MAWLMEQKQQGVVASQMLDVLGLGVSEGTAIDDDELWDAILSMGMRLIQPSIPVRQKLEHVNTIQDVVALLQQAKKIVVLAGAGISVSCGIPDFRSENGIYSVRNCGRVHIPGWTGSVKTDGCFTAWS
jgi:NAD+-dependent protein deacetylase sirtuin 1